MDGGKPVLKQIPNQIVNQRGENLLPYFQPTPGPAKGNGLEDADRLGCIQQGGDDFKVRYAAEWQDQRCLTR